jgi:P2X purinoceptor 3
MGLADSLFTYETVAVVKVRSRTLSIVHRSMQLFTIVYVALYIFWFQHGYQKEEKGLGSVSLKVKGVGHTRWDDAPDAADAGYMPTRGLGQMRVQDAVDIVYPPKEEGAMFLTTNFVDVPRQSRGRCPSLNTEDACSADSDCPKATPSDSMIGYRTGVCSLSTRTCEVLGWCPTEPSNASTPEDNVLAEVASFSIFARVAIDFPFADKRTNNLRNGSIDDLRSKVVELRRSSRHGAGEVSDLTRGLNLFLVSDVLEATNTSFTDVAVNGAVFSISFNWDCNLDRAVDECDPDVEIRRLDDYANKLSRGYNFRYATYYAENGTEYRYLRKAYGLRILVQSAGRARAFDWATVFVTLGSAVALLSVATVVVDGLAVYVLPKKDVYQRIKYQTIDAREEEERLEEERRAAEATPPFAAAKSYGTTGSTAPPASVDAKKGWFG